MKPLADYPTPICNAEALPSYCGVVALNLDDAKSLERKLALAVEALDHYADLADGRLAREALAAIKGE